ncbi:hypothetical protein [Streptomyces globosus]|nr:hypothetical protein [Streptomyces globosus]
MGMGVLLGCHTAALLVALLEGAQVLCRASGSTEPFERTARAALALFAES